MKNTWRLLDTGILSAAHNMSLEKVLLESRSRDMSPDTLHFLEFAPHCALLGYHQSLDLEIEEDYCKKHGIDINRRISGGGCIYYDEGQLGWEISVSKSTPGIPRRLEDLYRLMCESAITGLKKLGVEAKFRPHNDIEVDGRKISGTGGTEKGSALLYHGSLLTDFDADTMISCLKLPLTKLENKQVRSFKERVTCLKEVLGYLPPMSEIKKAMADGFAEVFGIEIKKGELSPYEQDLYRKELPFFESDKWIRGRGSVIQNNDLRTADYKSPGGLIRITMRLDEVRGIIKYIFITGDFFAYPSRIILDLEAALKNTPAEEETLCKLVKKFFQSNEVKIPGVSADDFCTALCLVLKQDEKIVAAGI